MVKYIAENFNEAVQDFREKKLLVSNFTIEHKLKVPKTLKGDIKTNIKHKKKLFR